MKAKLTKKTNLQVFNSLSFIYPVKDNLNTLFLANNSMSMSMSMSVSNKS